MFPKSWEGLRGTLGVQLAHLRDHIATLPVMVGVGKSRMVFSLTPQRKEKMLAIKSEGRYMHTAENLAAEFGLPSWRINELRAKFKAELEAAACAS